MKKQLSIWKLIRKSLQDDVPVMLLYVLESAGSSPGRQGFFMAVNSKREMSGSIGGGIMEHKFVEMTIDKLKHNEQEISIHRQIHDKSSALDQSGMICSGEQTNFIYRLQKKDFEKVDLIINVLENEKSGTLKLTNQGFFFESPIPKDDFLFEWEEEDTWRYEEKIGYKNHLYIIGGGHCALALSKIMQMMNFYIHLYDERYELNTFIENEYVHEKVVVKNYSELKDVMPTGNHSYVVVMTVGYRTDDIVIRSLLSKHFKYFGVLGSSKKIEKMFTDFKAEGIDESMLERIHAPIGIAINSQTPEEIAVSIAAQIIQVKNGKENLC